jgi:plastocyanin
MQPSNRYLFALLALTTGLGACQGHPDRGASEPPVVGVRDVIARDLQFEPPAIQVRPGTSVTWHFEDGAVAHDVRGDGFSSPGRRAGPSATASTSQAPSGTAARCTRT